MALYRGIDQYIKFNYATGLALDKTCYVIGGEMRDDSEILEVRPLADWRARVFAPLGIRSDGTINFVVFEEGILNLSERDINGNTGEFDIEGGMDLGAPSILHMKCKVDTLTLECNANAPLMATLGWKSKYRKNGAAIRQPYPDGVYANRPKVLLWSECAVSSADGNLSNFLNDIVGCTISINNNVDWRYTLGAAGDDATRDRAAKYLRSHQLVVTCDVRTIEEDTYELQADTVAPAADLVLLYTNGVLTVRITLTDLMRGTYTLPNVPNDDTVFTYKYNVRDFAIAAA